MSWLQAFLVPDYLKGNADHGDIVARLTDAITEQARPVNPFYSHHIVVFMRVCWSVYSSLFCCLVILARCRCLVTV